MQDSFYRNFIDENDKIIAFIGGGGKSTLMQRLSKDCASIGKSVVILSLFPYISPFGAKVLIADDLSIIKKQVPEELLISGILHLGRKYQKGNIVNFNISQIKKIIEEISCDHIFLEADSAKGRSLSGYKHVSVSIFNNIQRCIIVLGSDALNQSKNMNWIAHEDSFWHSKKVLMPIDIAAWHKSHPVFNKLSDISLPLTFFINKVENIYIENIAIPLAKSFKLAGVERAIIGSVFNSNLHVIK